MRSLFTPEENNLALKLHAAGCNVASISKIMNRDQETVRRHLRQLGIDTRASHVKFRDHPLTEEKKDTLRRLIDEGCSMNKVCNSLARKVEVIVAACAEMGIPLPTNAGNMKDYSPRILKQGERTVMGQPRPLFEDHQGAI